jgi:hypothetical protein
MVNAKDPGMAKAIRVNSQYAEVSMSSHLLQYIWSKDY